MLLLLVLMMLLVLMLLLTPVRLGLLVLMRLLTPARLGRLVLMLRMLVVASVRSNQFEPDRQDAETLGKRRESKEKWRDEKRES